MAFPEDMPMDEEVAPDDERAILQDLIDLAKRAEASKLKSMKPANQPMKPEGEI